MSEKIDSKWNYSRSITFSRAACDPDIASGPALASVATLGYGGMLLGPPTIGFVAEVTGLRWSFLILAGLALLAVVLAPRLAVTEQHGMSRNST